MKAALFDLDGVIIDTEGTYFEFWDSVGRQFGCRPTFALDIKGTTLTDILETYFKTPQDKAEVTQMIHNFENTMRYPIFDGVIDFVSQLKNRGFKLAVVTSSDDTKMSFLNKQHPSLMSMFDAVITGSMVTNSKPNPEGYLLAARLLGVDASDCYVFEDSFQGLEAGRRSGATVVALATTNPASSLKGKAHEVIDGFTGFTADELLSIG